MQTFSRVMTSALLIWGGYSLSAPGLGHAQNQSAHLIGPLNSRTVEKPTSNETYRETAADINSQMRQDQGTDSETEELDLQALPLIGDLVDENGNINLGGDLPIEVDFDSQTGAGTSLTIGREFILQQ